MANNRAARRLARFGHFSPERLWYQNNEFNDISIGRDIADAVNEVWKFANGPVDYTIHDLLWWEDPGCLYHSKCGVGTGYQLRCFFFDN